MKEKTSIKKKVSSLITKISLGSIITIGIIAVSALLILRTNTVSVSGQLGDMAAGDSQRALEEMTTERLLTLAENKAALSDGKLKAVQNSVEMIVYSAAEMIQNPERYRQNPAMPPDAGNAGIMAAQFLAAEGVPFTSIAAESALMGNIQNLLLNIIENNIDATSDYIGSELGYIIVIDEASDMKTEYFDPRERPWYRLAKENNALTWSDVYVDAYGRGLAITCAGPYYDRAGNIAGVAGIGTLLNELTEIVIGTKVGETGYAFMLNEMGRIIISGNIREDEDGSIIRENLLNSDNAELARVAGEMIRGGNGIERITIDGREYFIAHAALETLPWSLATVMEVDEAIAPALETWERIIHMKDSALGNINLIIIIVISVFVLILAVIVLVISYTSRRFSKTLTEPITVLQEGVHQIADGNLEYGIDINTGDEIEDLGQSVNKMASDLSEYIANLQKVTADKERIGAELNVATKIQASMLPCIFPAFPEREEFDIYASMLPAKEVGGDFYDFFLIDENRLALVIADVSGKGVPAALFMVIAKTLIKNNVQYGKPPKEVFDTVNDMLCENNDADMFVTAFMGILDIPSGRFTYVNAGHNPPLVKRSGADYQWLPTKPGFVLAGMDGMKFKQDEITLDQGDTLYLYTDGVTEAKNRNNKLFTEPRLLEVANNYRNSAPREFIEGVKLEIDAFADGEEQADDITMLAMKYENRRKPANKEQNMKELRILARIENLDAVQDFIVGELETAGCSMKLIMQIKIVVEEIFVNIARYAYNPEVGGALIRIAVGDDVVIEFEDKGKPYNPLEKEDPDVTAGAEEREPGGLGIFMVKNMMDAVEYRHEDKKNILLIRKTVVR